ncbi:MAG: hypothetical protein ACLR13_01600 [Acutalibacteraceae bacterium]
MTNIKEINYENYGSCISMSNQTIEMIVTVENNSYCIFRLYRRRKCFISRQRAKTLFLNNEISQICGQTAYHYLYGGQSLLFKSVPFAGSTLSDNEAVVYSMDDDGVLFQAPTQKLQVFNYPIKLC